MPVPVAGACSQLLQVTPTNVPACHSQAGTMSLLQSKLLLQPWERQGAQGGEALSAALNAAQGPAQRLRKTSSPNTTGWMSAGMGCLPSQSHSTALDMGCSKGYGHV